MNARVFTTTFLRPSAGAPKVLKVLVQFPINACLAGKIIFSVLCRQDLRPERWNGHCFFGQRSEVKLVFLDLLLSFKPLPPEAEPFKFAPEPRPQGKAWKRQGSQD